MENGVSVGAYETHIHPKLSGAFPPGSSRNYSLCSVQFFRCIYINRHSVFIACTCVFISVYFFPLIKFHKKNACDFEFSEWFSKLNVVLLERETPNNLPRG